MTAKEKIETYLVNSERNFATVRDWGEGSVNGWLRIDMGKYTTYKVLKQILLLSPSTIYRACKQLQKERILKIESCGLIWLLEKHLLFTCKDNENLKY